jgi:hypothetical protein
MVLKHKDDLNQLKEDIDMQEDLGVGAVWVVYHDVCRGG